jgi:hypothetical protein
MRWISPNNPYQTKQKLLLILHDIYLRHTFFLPPATHTLHSDSQRKKYNLLEDHRAKK